MNCKIYKNKRYLTISILLLIFVSLLFGKPIIKRIYLRLCDKDTLSTIYQKHGINAGKKLSDVFAKSNASYPPSAITLVALKDERLVELWSENKLIKKYNFTGFSGKLGPKLKPGDLQIPEGIYEITFLNPNSLFHLSMKINYPNPFDIQKAKEDKRTNLGDNIFIHGKSATIGCIPIGDEAIEELFTLVYITGKENAKVIISPYDMRIKNKTIKNNNISWLKEKYTKIKNALPKKEKL